MYVSFDGGKYDQRAEEQTIVKPNSKHYGVQAHLNVYNPKVIPQEEMYVPQSNVVIKLFFGDYGSGVGAGWAVSIIPISFLITACLVIVFKNCFLL